MKLHQAARDKECPLFFRQSKVVPHVLPDGPQLRDTIVSDRLPVRDDRAMDLGISIRLSQESHTEGTKVGPEKEIEGMESVCASASVLVVVLTTNLSFSCQLHTTVIEKTLWADLCVILNICAHQQVWKKGTVY